MSKAIRILTTLGSLSLVLCASSASAAIVGVSGAADILVPPGDSVGMGPNFFNDADPIIHGWNELQNVVLDRDIIVDIDTPGTYQNPFASANAIIPQGTLVSSHLLYYDPAQGGSRRLGTFTFEQNILGVILISRPNADDHLLATDFLMNPFSGASGGHFPLRGVEFGPETVILDAGLRDLRLNLVAGNPGDQIRVITAAAPVPEPTTWAMLGAGLILLGVARRRRR